jgi:hypothetical protein
LFPKLTAVREVFSEEPDDMDENTNPNGGRMGELTNSHAPVFFVSA